MPSEKWKYLIDRNQPREYNLLFPPNQQIESAFSPSNLDDCCQRISSLLYPVGIAIEQDLMDGNYRSAVEIFLQEVDSLTAHFVEDRHYEWFDDMYDPEFSVEEDWRLLLSFVRRFPDELWEYLRDGLTFLAETEAVRSYGIPDVGKWLDQLVSEFS